MEPAEAARICEEFFGLDVTLERSEPCPTLPATGKLPLDQTFFSVAIYIVLLLFWTALYAGSPRSPTRINIKPWVLDTLVVAPAAVLSFLLAVHSYIEPAHCQVYIFLVHLNAVVLIVSTHTKGLRAYFQWRDVRYGSDSVRLTKARLADRVGAFIAKMYLRDLYACLVWFFLVVVLTSICTIVIADVQPTPAYPYCRAVPSVEFAGAVWVGNLVALLVLCGLLGSLREMNPVLALFGLTTLCYGIFLGLAMTAYVQEWTRSYSVAGWDTPYLLATLYLYSQMLHLIVPVLVAKKDAYSRLQVILLTRLGILSHTLDCCFRYRRGSQLGMVDASSGGFWGVRDPETGALGDGDEDVGDDGLVTHAIPLANRNGSGGKAGASTTTASGRLTQYDMPPSLRARIDSLADRRYTLTNPPRTDGQLTMEAISGSVLIGNNAEMVLSRFGAAIYYHLMQQLYYLLTLKKADIVKFNVALKVIQMYARANDIPWPASVREGWTETGETDEEIHFQAESTPEARADADAAAAAAHAVTVVPATSNAMHQRIYPAIAYVEAVLVECLSYNSKISSRLPDPPEGAASKGAAGAAGSAASGPIALEDSDAL